MAPTTATFDDALSWLLRDEGGYSNHPQDHGGITQFGITQAAWQRYCGRVTDAEAMRAITRAQATAFYADVYWRPLGLADWERTAAIATLDMAVVMGAKTALALAQRALGVVPDGLPGPRTQAAAAPGACPDFVLHFVPHTAERFARICRADTSQCVFLVGWMRRSMRLLQLVQT